MRRIERLRGQHRHDLVEEIGLQRGMRVRRDAGVIGNGDAFLAQQRAQRLPCRALAFVQVAHRPPDCGELLRRAETVDGQPFDAALHLADQPGNPDHHEFVEVAAGNRQEPQPFEQRIFRIAGLGQHAGIEGEPAQLAIDVMVRRSLVRQLVFFERGDMRIGCGTGHRLTAGLAEHRGKRKAGLAHTSSLLRAICVMPRLPDPSRPSCTSTSITLAA